MFIDLYKNNTQSQGFKTKFRIMQVMFTSLLFKAYFCHNAILSVWVSLTHNKPPTPTLPLPTSSAN